MPTRLLLSAWLLLLSLAVAAEGPFGQQDAPPFFDARKHESAYNGPGRENPEPTDLIEVRIGYFGPSDPEHPEGGDLWLAVNLAIDEANAEGGYRGLPFRLVQAWADNPWTNGAGLVVRMAYVDKVWAIIGGIDGASAHLAETIVTKARLTLITPASTDKTVSLANVPWMFSALPGDHLLAPALGRSLLERIGTGKFIVVSSNDHDSRLFTRELEKFLSAHGRTPAFRFIFESGKVPDEEISQRIVETQPPGVVVIANMHDSASMIDSLRKRRFRGLVFGGTAMGRRRFRDGLIKWGAGIYFSCPAAVQADDFGRAFASRFGFYPDYTARYGYETTRLLVTAIRKGGLNRARIRDAVRELSPWEGVAASIEWDSLGQNRLLPDGSAVCAVTDGQLTLKGHR